MALRNFFNEIKGLKVKDVPGYIKPMLSKEFIKTRVNNALDNYNAKYIQTSSIQPLHHVLFGGIVFSYLIALPEERRHMEHEKHKKQQGH
eukprot:Gb_17974 [translate_table: standard]